MNQNRPDVFNQPDPSNASASHGVEAYGWVYSDGIGDFIYTNPQYGALDQNNNFDPGYPPDYSGLGWTAVGIYHTHPYNPGGTASQTQITTGLHFSPGDVAYARSNNVTMYVGVQAALDDQHPETMALRWYSLSADGRSETQQGLVGGNKC